MVMPNSGEEDVAARSTTAEQGPAARLRTYAGRPPPSRASAGTRSTRR